MRKILFATAFLLCALSGKAQEKVLNVQNVDGTTTQTRVADLDQISFLTVDQGGQGLLVKTLGGEIVGVLFETGPIVTISNGKLLVKPDTGESVEFEISDIAEIQFGDAREYTGITPVKAFSYVLNDGGALLRGIPEGVKPRVYTVDGRSIPAPAVSGGELHLDRSTLGTGVFIIKVGTFSTKIKI